MKIKERLTPETIIVYPIDSDRLSADLNEKTHEKYPEIPVARIFSVRSHEAIIKEPKLCLIDDEFCGFEIKDDKVDFDIYWEENTGDGGKILSGFPAYEVSLTLANLEDYLLPPITLAEHTKARRNYNARIRRNECVWVEALNR